MKTTTTILLLSTILISACTPFSAVEQHQLNQTRTLDQVCYQYRSALSWGNAEASTLMLDEIKGRGVFSPREIRGLSTGYAQAGYTGYSLGAIACRFTLIEDGTSYVGGSRYEWYNAYGDPEVVRILIVDGVVASTYSY